MNNKKYWVYILEVSNGHYYTGYTNNMQRRYQEHIKGNTKCKYTRSFKPVGIKQCWQINESQGTAMKVESFIKRKNRKTKQEIMQHPEKLKQMISKSLNLNLKIRKYNFKNI